jgi:pimeloyl-ACP methyl ester carboxylesterase
MPMIQLSEQRISYREQGEGRPPLLLVHSAGGSSFQYAELIGLLARGGRRVVALDLPGHGSSPSFTAAPHPSELLERYREVVAEFGEALGLGRLVLVGHSMGGAVAQHLALAHPERVAGLVLAATAARLKVAPLLLAAIRHQFDHLPTMLEGVGFSPASDPGRVASWAVRQIQAPREIVLADFLACGSFDLRDRVASISCPTLVISAADDRLTPPQLQQRLAGLIPRATLTVVHRTGHLLFWERPDRVAELILSKLKV